MPDYTGKNLVMSFIHPSGTITMNTDYRTVNTTETVGLADFTAGADTDRSYGATVKDGSLSYAGLHQAVGTAFKQALEAGNVGTVILSPEGTASGKPKETYPVISQGAKMNYPYDNVVEVSCDFQKNGARVDTAW